MILTKSSEKYIEALDLYTETIEMIWIISFIVYRKHVENKIPSLQTFDLCT